MSGGGAEAWTTPIQAILGADRPGFPGNKGGTCSIGGKRVYGDGRIIGMGRIW